MRCGLSSTRPTRRLVADLIGGITVDELPAELPGPGDGRGRRQRVCVAALPSHLFTRDTTCWIYGGVSLNPMAMVARRRRPLTEAIYRFHPLFADARFERWFGGVDSDVGGATIEGGDVHVIGQGAVLVGMGERTTPQAVEALARRLFAAGAASIVVAVALPAAVHSCTSTR